MVFVQGNETLNRLGSRKNNAQYVLVTLWTLKRIKKEQNQKFTYQSEKSQNIHSYTKTDSILWKHKLM